MEAIRNEGNIKEEILADQLLKWVELDGKRNLSIECYHRQAIKQKELFDKKLKDKGIKEGSLVLSYNNKLDNRFDAKFISRWEGPFVVLQAFSSGYYQLMDLDGTPHKRKVNGYRMKPYLSRELPRDASDLKEEEAYTFCRKPKHQCYDPGDSKLIEGAESTMVH